MPRKEVQQERDRAKIGMSTDAGDGIRGERRDRHAMIAMHGIVKSPKDRIIFERRSCLG